MKFEQGVEGRFVFTNLIANECRDNIREASNYRAMLMMREGAASFDARENVLKI